MSALKLSRWDSAAHLKTDEDIALYMEAVMEEAGDDAAFVAHALGVVARARGMTQLASDTGLGRESLYKALSGEGNPSFATILKVARALGVHDIDRQILPRPELLAQFADGFRKALLTVHNQLQSITPELMLCTSRR